jgi:hypothetical protein
VRATVAATDPDTTGSSRETAVRSTNSAARRAAGPVPWSNVPTAAMSPGRTAAKASSSTIESRPPETASKYRPGRAARTAERTRSSAASLCVVTTLKYHALAGTTFVRGTSRSTALESSFGGPLGTLIAGLGMGAYYIGLTWINVLLGVVLTPFFIIPLTWVQDALAKRKAARQP